MKKMKKKGIFEIFWDFLGFLDSLTIFDNFWIFGVLMDLLDYFRFYWIFLILFWIFFGIFWIFFLVFLDVWIFEYVWIFFWIFFGFFLVPFKVTKVTTKCYHGYYWTPKIAKNGPKPHKKLFFCPKEKKSLGRSPPQELEVVPHSGSYLLVLIKDSCQRRWNSFTWVIN